MNEFIDKEYYNYMNLIPHSFLFFLLTVSLFIFSPIYAQESENDAEYISAILVGSPEDIRMALKQTRQFLVDNPYHLEQRANECAYLLKLKLLDETQTCLEKATSDFPKDLVIQENLGGFYFLNKEYLAAKTQLAIVHNLDPDDTSNYANYLSARVMAGDDPDEIIPEIKALIKKDPSVPNLFLTIAKLFNDKNQPSEARNFLEQIHVTNNTSIKYFTQLGISYGLEGDFTNAEKYLLQGYERNPNDIGVLKNLGKVYSDLGDEAGDIGYYYKSIGYYESVLQLEPENISANIGVNYSAEKIQNLYQKFYFIIYLIVAIVFGLIILVIWGLGYDNKKLEKIFQTTTDEKEKKSIVRKILITKLSRLFLVGAMMIIGTILSISLIFEIPLNDRWDMANWTATIIEIGIGVMIAIVILVYELSKNEKVLDQQEVIEGVVTDISSQQTDIENIVLDIDNQQENLSKLVEDVKQIQKEQQEFVKNENERIKHWKIRFGNLIHEDLSSIKQLYDALEDWIKNYQKNPTPEQKSNIIRNAKNNGDLIKFHTQNILRFLPKIESYFVDPVLGVNITNLCKHYPTLFFSMKEEYSWSSEGLEGTLLSIKEKQKFLDRDMQRIIDEGALPEE